MVSDYRWVLQLVDRCYEAAVDDAHWTGILKDLRTFLGGESTTLFSTDTQLRPVDRFFGENVSPESIASYQAHFYQVDIRMQRSIPSGLNRIVTDRDLVDEATVDSHEFYQDFLRPIGHRYIVSAAMDLGGGNYAFCSCHRGLREDHADSDTVDRAGLIMPHIRRSLQLRRRLLLSKTHNEAALELLDGLGQAVFLIDADGRIVWQNAWGDRVLRQRDGLITSEGELRTKFAAVNTELQQLIKSAVTSPGRPRTRPGGMMTVPRSSLKRPYQVLVTPLSKSKDARLTSSLREVSPVAAIFIMDLEQNSMPHAEVLKTIYNLTPSEARLATALGSGVSIKTYAEEAELSINYVRWLLKQVEAKTDTRRITDLIRLLARQTDFFGAIIENKREKDK